MDRLAPVTGLNRDYLATALSQYGKVGKDEKEKGKGRKRRPQDKRGGRPVKYGYSGVLQAIWLEYGITPEIRSLLLHVSPAEVDILLKPRRKAMEIKGISTTRVAQTPLRKQIPVRTSTSGVRKRSPDSSRSTR